MSKQSCIRDVADLSQINRCIDSLNKVKPSILKLSDILKLAGNDVRLKILYLLSTEDDLCPCDLSDILDMTVPAVSQHLRKLKDAGILQPRREGQLIFYSLQEPYDEILKPLFNQIKNNSIMESFAA
ncbi:MAG: metalloregulator ArsR/SmtB family transcription factor [Balneolales bacterium]